MEYTGATAAPAAADPAASQLSHPYRRDLGRRPGPGRTPGTGGPDVTADTWQ
ncbi:hypothetical protein [Streptacidiphilus sp. P02-A3a]|uniref:hypothetical protein n=1 Tax=Streptacidiphilus sp. P02-A3a TaxID=2704468 RepID=UPI0015FAFB9E|nr:hypothetical protein [Streptacidiphilus sp. P02-A3a]QMU68423.1 hypothetical protein GXP74_09485 [Streptacidiphilus sp. P02-A3a]